MGSFPFLGRLKQTRWRAVLPDRDSFGVGMVCKDEHRVVLFADKICCLPGKFRLTWPYGKGIRLVLRLQLQLWVLECDALDVVRAIQHISPLALETPLVEEIQYSACAQFLDAELNTVQGNH